MCPCIFSNVGFSTGPRGPGGGDAAEAHPGPLQPRGRVVARKERSGDGRVAPLGRTYATLTVTIISQ